MDEASERSRVWKPVMHAFTSTTRSIGRDPEAIHGTEYEDVEIRMIPYRGYDERDFFAHTVGNSHTEEVPVFMPRWALVNNSSVLRQLITFHQMMKPDQPIKLRTYYSSRTWETFRDWALSGTFVLVVDEFIFHSLKDWLDELLALLHFCIFYQVWQLEELVKDELIDIMTTKPVTEWICPYYPEDNFEWIQWMFPHGLTPLSVKRAVMTLAWQCVDFIQDDQQQARRAWFDRSMADLAVGGRFWRPTTMIHAMHASVTHSDDYVLGTENARPVTGDMIARLFRHISRVIYEHTIYGEI